jgi:hypothetical protein
MLRIALKCRTPGSKPSAHTIFATTLPWGKREKEKKCKSEPLHPFAFLPPMFLMPIAGVCKDVTPGP